MDANTMVNVLVTNGVGVVCAGAMLWLSWYRETVSIPKIMDTMLTLVREERTVCQKWHEENRECLANILAEVRENRHYQRDLAHMLGLRNAVDEAKRKKEEELRREHATAEADKKC